MPSSVSSVLMARSLADVWDFVADVDNLSLWSPAVVSARSLTPGPIRVGRRVEGTSRFLMSTVHWTGEVTELDAPYRFTFASTDAPFSFHTVTTLKPARYGTELHVRTDFDNDQTGLFAATTDRVVASIYTRMLRSTLGNAADILNRGPLPDSTNALRRTYGLTEREIGVLGLLASGASNRKVAAELHLSPRTVEAHVNRIFIKLDIPRDGEVNGRVAAAVLYQRAIDPMA